MPKDVELGPKLLALPSIIKEYKATAQWRISDKSRSGNKIILRLPFVDFSGNFYNNMKLNQLIKESLHVQTFHRFNQFQSSSQNSVYNKTLAGYFLYGTFFLTLENDLGDQCASIHPNFDCLYVCCCWGDMDSLESNLDSHCQIFLTKEEYYLSTQLNKKGAPIVICYAHYYNTLKNVNFVFFLYILCEQAETKYPKFFQLLFVFETFCTCFHTICIFDQLELNYMTSQILIFKNLGSSILPWLIAIISHNLRFKAYQLNTFLIVSQKVFVQVG